jgi:hypothetical protein
VAIQTGFSNDEANAVSKKIIERGHAKAFSGCTGALILDLAWGNVSNLQSYLDDENSAGLRLLAKLEYWDPTAVCLPLNIRLLGQIYTRSRSNQLK